LIEIISFLPYETTRLDQTDSSLGIKVLELRTQRIYSRLDESGDFKDKLLKQNMFRTSRKI